MTGGDREEAVSTPVGQDSNPVRIQTGLESCPTNPKVKGMLMNAGFADFSGSARARSAAVPAEESSTMGAASAQAAADEATLTNILRLLHRVRPAAPLSPVERAFVLGARAMFEQLAKVCDDLLARQSAAHASPTPGATASLATPTDPAQPHRIANEPAPTGRHRSGRRSNPGGTQEPRPHDEE